MRYAIRQGPRLSVAALIALIAMTSVPIPQAAAQATAQPVFPPADLERSARAPDFAAWFFDRLSLPAPDLSHAVWENLSAGALADRAMDIALRYSFEDAMGIERLDYTSDGYFREGWIDVASSIGAAGATEASLRNASLDTASRLGLPTEGLQVDIHADSVPFVSLDGSLPWGTAVHAQSLFLRFGGANVTLDRLVFTAWFEGTGTPTVTADAARATAVQAATARGNGEPLRVAAVGASVTGGGNPAWVFTIQEGACSTETSYYFVDGEAGAYLGRRSGVIADAVCPPTFLSVPLFAWALAALVAALAVAGVVLWRRRARRAPGASMRPQPGK